MRSLTSQDFSLTSAKDRNGTASITSSEGVGQIFITRVTLKMRKECGMTSAKAGEVPDNTLVQLRESRTLPDGTRRAKVIEVGSSPERSGWVSCVAKDGRETLDHDVTHVYEQKLGNALPLVQGAFSSDGGQVVNEVKNLGVSPSFMQGALSGLAAQGMSEKKWATEYLPAYAAQKAAVFSEPIKGRCSFRVGSSPCHLSRLDRPA